jgi:outer membrane protein assembly factor BamB
MRRLVLVVFLLPLAARAANWPQWRGPTWNGVAEPGDYPLKFTNVLWKVALPGKGSSTPIVWGDRIVITCGIGEGAQGQDGVLCFNRDGEQQWRTPLGPQRPGKHRNGSGSCPSVATDGTHIFAYFKSGTLAALDFDGEVQWKTNLQKTYGKDTLWWDLGTSPVLAAGNVIVAVMQDGDSYVAAFKKDTGKVAWKVDRTFNCERESDQAYTTPIVMRDKERTTLVIWGADHLTGQDAATGKRLWTCGGFNPRNTPFWRVIASASVSDGVAVVPYGRGRRLAGVRVGGSGDVTATNRLWEKDGIGSDCPTPVTANGMVYHLSDRGTVTCLAIESGKVLWQHDLPKARGNFYSSPTLAGDRLYMIRENGTAYVCAVSDTGLKVLTQAELGDRVAATPVPIDGRLLVRGMANLVCFGK